MTGRRHLDQRLRLHLLRAVDAIETHRSLLKASVALGITQPALTKSLQELEAILQTRLFDRHTRGVRPIEVGPASFTGARTARRLGLGAWPGQDDLRWRRGMLHPSVTGVGHGQPREERHTVCKGACGSAQVSRAPVPVAKPGERRTARTKLGAATC